MFNVLRWSIIPITHHSYFSLLEIGDISPLNDLTNWLPKKITKMQHVIEISEINMTKYKHPSPTIQDLKDKLHLDTF